MPPAATPDRPVVAAAGRQQAFSTAPAGASPDAETTQATSATRATPRDEASAPNPVPAPHIAVVPDGAQQPAPASPVALPAASPNASSASPAAATPTVPAPAQQALPALVALGHGPGTQQVTVQLAPDELGRLQVRIERSRDGPARVTLTAERAETLDLVMRDAGQLHRALDQAGVPAEGRTLTFHLSPSVPDAVQPATPQPAQQAVGSAAAPATALAAGGDGTGTGRGTQHDANQPGHRRTSGGGALPEDDPIGPARWLRAGLDITA